jgi:ABC-2 type transport system permease protein
MPRPYVVYAVFQRNFWSYFSGLLGYLFVTVFVLAGALLAFREQFFTNNLATLDQLNLFFPQLLLFIVPAITMGVWAEERKLGTDELLFTLPVSDLEVLLGKYKAVVSVYSVALLFSLTHCVVLSWIGDPDPYLIATTYLGYWLAGCALLSAGMVASYLTNSTTVAFVAGVVICAIPVFIGSLPMPVFLSRMIGHDQLFEQLSLANQFQPFGTGVIPLSGVAYFVSFSAFMLYINLVLIGQRHWSGGKLGDFMGWQYLARAVSLGVILISANAVFANFNRSIDATSEGLYTLTETTRSALKSLKSERPVTIQAFVSRTVPREYVPVRSSLLGLLSQYEQNSRGNVTVRVVSVQPFSPEADEAKRFGIEPRKVSSERGGRLQLEDVFLGCVINSGSSEIVIPFFDVATPIEYELTRSVRTAANEKRRTIGILDTDAKIQGGFDMSSFRSNPEWRIVTELKKQYNVETVMASGPIDDTKYDVLVAVLPSSLDQNGMQNLVDYVRKGKPTLIFDDPLPAFNPSAAPRQPKPRQGGMMGGGPPPEQKADGGKATALVDLLGIQWNYDEVVWANTITVLHPEYADVVRPEMVAISRKSGLASAFSPKSEVTSGLQELLLFFSGTIKPRQGSPLVFEPLLRTGQNSGLLAWDQFVQPGFFGGVELIEDPRRVIDDEAHVVAAEIKSAEKSTGDKVHVIYVADTDVMSDWFFAVRDRRMHGLDLDNVTFVLNAVDQLSGDTADIALRKRRSKHRTLTRVEAATERFIQQSTKERETAAEEATKALEDAKRRFREKVERIQKDESLDSLQKQGQLQIAQREESRRVEVEEATIEQRKQRRIDEVKARTEQQVRQIENRYFLMATVFPPIPAIALGLLVWFIRVSNEQREVPPSRRVAGRR